MSALVRLSAILGIFVHPKALPSPCALNCTPEGPFKCERDALKGPTLCAKMSAQMSSLTANCANFYIHSLSPEGEINKIFVVELNAYMTRYRQLKTCFGEEGSEDGNDILQKQRQVQLRKFYLCVPIDHICDYCHDYRKMIHGCFLRCMAFLAGCLETARLRTL